MLIKPGRGIGFILLCIVALSHLSPTVDATILLKSLLKPFIQKRAPTTIRIVTLKGCDRDDDIRTINDQTITGRVEVEAHHCHKRFRYDKLRIAALQKVVTEQLKRYHKELFKTNFNYQVALQVIGGDKKFVIFSFTIKAAKIHHDQVRTCLKKTCRCEEVKNKIAEESLKKPGDEDSSSSSEEDEQQPKVPAQWDGANPVQHPGKEEPKVEPVEEPKHEEHVPIEEAPVEKPEPVHHVPEPHKPIRKPSRPVQIDCNKGHRITLNNDKQITGVLVVKLCRSKLFIRKQKRCLSVRDKIAALLHGGLLKFGIKDKYNVNIIKTIGTGSQTEFHYTVQCDKPRQSNVVTCLKDACKNKDLIDTITREKQPDSSESSSEESLESEDEIHGIKKKSAVVIKPVGSLLSGGRFRRDLD